MPGPILMHRSFPAIVPEAPSVGTIWLGKSQNQKEQSVIESAVVEEVLGGVPSLVANAGSTRPAINVWIVDNQPIIQQVVATALDQAGGFLLGGYFVHPEDALQRDDDANPPDVILMDVQEFGSGGIQAVRLFRKAFPRVALIILTESVEEEVVWAAICAGASGYLLKTSSTEKIVQSIREVLAGGASLAPVVARSVLEMVRRLSGARPDNALTGRELRVLDLMGQGLLMKEIAAQLAVSYHTVDTHLRNIYAKLGVRSRTGAVAKALRERII
jgi:DNA-binding NarL/FixJ family response regulator